VLLLALVGGFAFVVPGSALATVGHGFAGGFGGAGTGDGLFRSNPVGGLGVLGSSGEVLVFGLGTDPGTGNAFPRVQRFDGSGGFVSAFGVAPPSYPVADQGAVAVDQASGAVYLLELESNGGLRAPYRVLKYSAAGVFEHELEVPAAGPLDPEPAPGGLSFNYGGSGLAIDPVDESVYAAATTTEGTQVVARFDGSTGAFIESFDGSSNSPDATGFGCPSGLAVDTSHRVYVLDACKNRVDRYSASGAYEETLALPQHDGNPETPSAVATDPSSGEVYVSHTGPVGTRVTHFAADGSLVYTFDASMVAGVKAMAVNATGTVYIADSAEPVIDRFVMFDGPAVATGATTPPEARSVTLEGTIDPEGAAADYYFEYGTGSTYGSRTETVDAGSGSGPVAVSAAITGLKPNRTYHYRLVGSRPGAEGVIVGADGSFTTDVAPASVDGLPDGFSPAFVTALGSRSVRIHGTVNPNSPPGGFFASASYSFQYGTTTGYGQSVAAGSCDGFSSICGGDDLGVSAQLLGLSPATTYHFRVVANNNVGGDQYGADQTFTTAPAAGGGATGVTTKRATLTGTINPHGEDTTYRFNYGPTSAYGASTPEVDAGAGDGDQQVSLPVSGLSPDTTYHVQVVATSDNGVVRYGADGLFKTAPAPMAEAISPIGVSTSSATLVGEVDTHGRPGTYRFDVTSLNSAYQSSTAERPVAGNDGVERVNVSVDGLPAGETFVVRLVVTSNDSTTLSDQVTFATASVPTVFPPPPTGDGASSYGCTAPHLDSYNAKPKPGDTITVSGQDLGAGGTAILDDRSIVPADWTASGFELEIPDDATGTLGLTINCGKRSNTIAIAIYKRPSNRFSIANTTVTGAKATLSVKVAGPGKLTSRATKAKPGRVTIGKARGARLVVRLNRAGIRALRKSKTGRLKVPLRVRYLPAGGKSATKTVTVTFNRTVGR
jgi:hypothetical protein